MKSLHKLIHSLTQAERRHIKIRLTSNKSNSEITKYYDEFVKQEKYDIKKLENKFKKPSKLLLANFGKLFSSILKILRSLHSENSSETLIQGMLVDVNLLISKGLENEALKINTRIIEAAEKKELFDTLKKAYNNEWLITHLTGNLSKSFTKEIQRKIDICTEKENEINELSKLSKYALVAYHQYFFIKKEEEYLKEINDINSNPLLPEKQVYLSDEATMISYEIKAIFYTFHNNKEELLNIRKLQFKLIFGSPVFEEQHMNKVLIAGNLFSILSTPDNGAAMKKYFNFFNTHFSTIIKETSDAVLLEKYHDVYFQSKIYLLKWGKQDYEIPALTAQIKHTIEKQVLLNQNLVARTLLSVAELLILHNKNKEAIQWIIDFQDTYKKHKTSQFFINSELYFLIIYWNLKKYDAFDNKLMNLKRKVATENTVLEKEQEILLTIFYSLANSTTPNKSDLSQQLKHTEKNKIFKLFLLSLINESNIAIEKVKPN